MNRYCDDGVTLIEDGMRRRIVATEVTISVGRVVLYRVVNSLKSEKAVDSRNPEIQVTSTVSHEQFEREARIPRRMLG